MLRRFQEDPKLRVIDNLRSDMVVSAAGVIDHWTVDTIFSWPKIKKHPGAAWRGSRHRWPRRAPGIALG